VKKSEGRGKREEGRFFPISHSLAHSPHRILSPVTTVRILPIKCFNYLGWATKSSKKLMKNQKKTALLKK